MSEAPPLALHDTGDGPPLLFLHAFPLDASQWDHQVAALSGSYRCLRTDNWGCGDSPPPPADAPSIDAMARAVLATLDAQRIDSFAVCGLSLGGYVAFALLQMARERITALILCNTRASADSEQARADRAAVAERVEREASVESLVEPNVERLLGPHAQLEVHITDPLRGRIRRCTPAGIAYAQRAMAARPDRTSDLASIGVPTLVIAGAHDAVIPADDIAALSRGISGARTETLECGHLSNLELPERFSDVAGAFLESAIRT